MAKNGSIHMQKPARVVAISDLVVVLYELIHKVGFVSIMAGVLEAEESGTLVKSSNFLDEVLKRQLDHLKSEALIEVSYKTLWITVGVWLFCEFVHLFSVFLLLKATTMPGKNLQKGQQDYIMCQIWLIVSVILIVLETINGIVFGVNFIALLVFLIRLCFPNLVHRFMLEMKETQKVEESPVFDEDEVKVILKKNAEMQFQPVLHHLSLSNDDNVVGKNIICS